LEKAIEAIEGLRNRYASNFDFDAVLKKLVFFERAFSNPTFMGRTIIQLGGITISSTRYFGFGWKKYVRKGRSTGVGILKIGWLGIGMKEVSKVRLCCICGKKLGMTTKLTVRQAKPKCRDCSFRRFMGMKK
jgi:DNA-directed RNA polymerase subunit RPC12/RpoP